MNKKDVIKLFEIIGCVNGVRATVECSHTYDVLTYYGGELRNIADKYLEESSGDE